MDVYRSLFSLCHSQKRWADWRIRCNSCCSLAFKTETKKSSREKRLIYLFIPSVSLSSTWCLIGFLRSRPPKCYTSQVSKSIECRYSEMTQSTDVFPVSFIDYCLFSIKHRLCWSISRQPHVVFHISMPLNESHLMESVGPLLFVCIVAVRLSSCRFHQLSREN